MKIVAVTLLVMLIGAGAAAAYVADWNTSPVAIEHPVTVTLHAGEPFSAFALRLHDDGVISHPQLWSRLAAVRGLARDVRAGEYRVATGETPESLLRRLLAGDVVTYEVQLIEGWTAMQAVAALGARTELRRELRGVDVSTLLDVLGLPAGHAEGMFFPDTYQFVRGDSDAAIMRRAYERMQQVLAAEWERRDPGLPYESAYQALIVASLVEKETGRDADRARIGQVFATRLREGMRLQTDPSVIYGLGSRFNGNLQRRHLREDTPYNTYTRRGLPPTPIALPGAKSIAAVMHPAPGDFRYFVSRGDGSSHFSRSLAEHEAAVRKYQLQ